LDGDLSQTDPSSARLFLANDNSEIGAITKVKETVMSILTWIVLGLIVGFIANKLFNKTGEGVFMNIVLGGIGAVLGGELINKFGMAGATWLNLWSVLVSVSGAALFLVVYNALAMRALKTD
jgi:uncharacterized membrane protein YeaQ/YmgE (transglycosylase-associated protein family)